MTNTLLACLFITLCGGTPLIQTKLGPLVGVTENDVYQYRNIPYGKPPTTHLRFAKPVPYGPWHGILDATRFGPSCMQPRWSEQDISIPNENQSEDCLSLNIYIPVFHSSVLNKSVIIWIHGGAFISGQAMYYDPSSLALAGDIIVVTINYRLGVFGFLSNLDDTLPGNYGLWDQRLAFQWVHNNIASFGGNPNSVTILGESAGSFSVSLHTLNPKNTELFQRVITQSGVATSPAITWETAGNFTYNFIRMLGCSNFSKGNDSYLTCLQRISAERLLKAQTDLLQRRASSHVLPNLQLPIGPVVDGILLPASPHILLMNKSSSAYKYFRSIDYMTGNDNQEGSLFLNGLTMISKRYNFNLSTGIPSNVFCQGIVPAMIATFSNFFPNKISQESVCSLYNRSNTGAQANEVLNAFSDILFIVPTVKSLNIHSEHNSETRTYQFMFERQSPVRNQFPDWFVGSPHAAELLFLFGIHGKSALVRQNAKFSQVMMKYWTNFAKTGNPNSRDTPYWEPYDRSSQAYIDLGSTVTPKTRVYHDRVSLWLGS